MSARPKRQIVVPLVVLALAVLVWRWPAAGDDPRLDAPRDVERCSENLRALYAGLLEHQKRFGRAPAGSGTAFLAELISSGVWADTPETRARLTCPGPGAARVRADVDYRRLETLAPADSAYAARDTARCPLVKFPSGGAELEPLVACDNAHGANHAGCTNLLYSDGSVVVLLDEQLRARGLLAEGARAPKAGPASPVPELAKLAGD